MDELLIKVRLYLNCDSELIEHFKTVPKRRRAEQARKLMLDGLRSRLAYLSKNNSTQPVSHNITPTEGLLNDDYLFSKDMKALTGS